MHVQLRSLLPGLSRGVPRGGSGMRTRSPGAAAAKAFHGTADILEQLQMAVVVTDRSCNLLYANSFAASLLGFPDDPAHLVGRSLVSLGFEEGDARRVSDLATQVLHGREWEGTFASRHVDGSWVFIRARAVPQRLPSGEISGIAIMASDATRRSSRSERDRLRLLERIGERLARSLELEVTLRQVAETLVPQFADHCLVDLFQGDKLIRKAQLHSRGWMPAPGTWAQVGEQITYPEGHFCQQAMARRDTVVVADMSEERNYGADDGDFLSLIGSRVAIAIDNAMLFEQERRTALAFQTSLLQRDPPV